MCYFCLSKFMNISKSQPSILWVQVLALAGVQGAITLTWLVYKGNAENP